MDKVLDRLWIGDAADGRNTQLITANGITAVFNATQETDGWSEEFKTKVAYIRLDQPDGVPIPFDRLDIFTTFMDKVYDLEQKTVLVHCGAGVSRASTFTILTLMLYHTKTWDEGEEIVRAVRPMISPNPILKTSVMDWWVYRAGNWLR